MNATPAWPTCRLVMTALLVTVGCAGRARVLNPGEAVRGGEHGLPEASAGADGGRESSPDISSSPTDAFESGHRMGADGGLSGREHGQPAGDGIPGSDADAIGQADGRLAGLCGDGVCSPGAEDCANCPADCAPCPELTEGFVRIEAGSFWMGSPDGCPGPQGYPGDCTAEPGRMSDEALHFVTLTRPFEMQRHEVTEGQWAQAVGGWLPGKAYGDDYPVTGLTWYEACAFANRMSEQAGLTACYLLSRVVCGDGGPAESAQECLNSDRGGVFKADVSLWPPTLYSCPGYRLPTEAEWEYAARAGTLTAYHNGGASDDFHLQCQTPFHLTGISWYCANKDGWGPHEVGQKQPNSWGLYDMSGNAREYCTDRPGDYQEGTPEEPLIDPVSFIPSNEPAARGGSWYHLARLCRSAARGGETHTGLRLVRTISP